MTQENKDIQPQAEPYIVKLHDIHIDAGLCGLDSGH